jgi:hypothetical protein
MANESLTQEYLKELFEYKDGELYWKKINPYAHNIKIGSIAGCLEKNSYKRTRIKNKAYLNHRLIFLIFYGYLPKFIDHIDGNPSNNKIENLREVTHSQNIQNSKKIIRNTSGVKNVNWHKRMNKWVVQLCINGKNKHFGYFDDIKIAELVAQEARNKYYGIYARHK